MSARAAEYVAAMTGFTNLDVVTGTLDRDEAPRRSVFIDGDRFMARDARCNPGRYESRIHHYLRVPPLPDWDGVFAAESR